MREDGFYFVQSEDECWEVAEWSERRLCWERIGLEQDYVDPDFIKINENRIKNPTEDNK